MKKYGTNALPAGVSKSLQYAFFQKMYTLEGRKMPSFSLNDFNGTQVSNELLKGEISVINFWYFGCGACMYEIPMLNKLQQEFANDTNIRWDSFFQDSIKYNRTHDTLLFENNHVINYGAKPLPRFLPIDFTFRHVGNVTHLDSVLQIKGYPTTLIIDRNGIIRKEFIGAGPSVANKITNAINFTNKYIQ